MDDSKELIMCRCEVLRVPDSDSYGSDCRFLVRRHRRRGTRHRSLVYSNGFPHPRTALPRHNQGLNVRRAPTPVRIVRKTFSEIDLVIYQKNNNKGLAKRNIPYVVATMHPDHKDDRVQFRACERKRNSLCVGLANDFGLCCCFMSL